MGIVIPVLRVIDGASLLAIALSRSAPRKSLVISLFRSASRLVSFCPCLPSFFVLEYARIELPPEPMHRNLPEPMHRNNYSDIYRT